jgi:hypothetical protein
MRWIAGGQSAARVRREYCPRRMGNKVVNGMPAPQTDEPDWVHLVDVERRLEVQSAAAREEARVRVAQARAAIAAAVPDAAATAALAAEEERLDLERHRAEIARLDDEAEALVRSLDLAPDRLVETLARLALDAALADAADAAASGRR